MVEEDVLPHAEALPHPEVVEQCALLDLKHVEIVDSMVNSDW